MKDLGKLNTISCAGLFAEQCQNPSAKFQIISNVQNLNNQTGRKHIAQYVLSFGI